MKTIFKSAVMVLALCLGLCACSSPTSSNTSSGNSLTSAAPAVTTEQWTTPSKAELVGTWKANSTVSGISCTTTYTVDAAYTSRQLIEGDYSSDPTKYSTVVSLLDGMNESGYTTSHDTTNKKFTAGINLTAAQLDSVISSAGWLINSAKNQIKYTAEGTTVYMNKQ